METPKEYYYTYYSYEEYGRGYIGSRKCYCLPEEDTKYFGSSKDKTFKPKYKIILKDDYTTREEALADEIILQRHYKVVENPHFANRSYQSSTKFYLTREEAKKCGERGSRKQKNLGIGFYGMTKEKRIQNGKKGYANGLAKLTKKERQERGRKNGINNYKSGVGIHGRTKEQMIESARKAGKIGGRKTYELGVGIHAIPPEEKAEISRRAGKIGGKITSSQKWMCLETGFITNAGNLAQYQKTRGIDTTKRIRIK